MNMNYFYLFFAAPFVSIFLIWGLQLLIFKLGLKHMKNKKVIPVEENFFYRDIPCFKDINLVYWLLYNFSNEDKDDLRNNLIGAHLLNWYKKGYIKITKSKNNRDYNINLGDGKFKKTEIEKEIYNFLKEVSGNNNILETNEINNYCSVDGNSFQLNFLFDKILDMVKKDLIKKNYISVVEGKDYLLFKSETKITLGKELIKEYKNLMGLKNFLLDFSLIDEKNHIDICVWEEYLVFATVLGIADTFRKQINEIYPDFDSDGLFSINLDNTITGHLTNFYNNMKLNFISLFVMLALCFITLFVGENKLKYFVAILPFIILIFIIFKIIQKHLIYIKVKEMSMKTTAKITEVEITYNSASSTSKYICSYKYSVDDKVYTGYDTFSSKKKVGQKLKIYYNEMKPNKSESAMNHNQYIKQLFIVLFFILLFGVIIFALNI